MPQATMLSGDSPTMVKKLNKKAAGIPTAKDTMPGCGSRNTNDCYTAVFDLASTGLAQCCEISIDNSICSVYNTCTGSKCRRIMCQIGAKII